MHDNDWEALAYYFRRQLIEAQQDRLRLLEKFLFTEEQEQESFEIWWYTTGQTLGKVAAWEAWKARAKMTKE